MVSHMCKMCITYCMLGALDKLQTYPDLYSELVFRSENVKCVAFDEIERDLHRYMYIRRSPAQHFCVEWSPVHFVCMEWSHVHYRMEYEPELCAFCMCGMGPCVFCVYGMEYGMEQSAHGMV